MPNLPTKRAGGHAGSLLRVSGGTTPHPGSPVLRNGISIEPKRSATPNTTETEPTEASTSLVTDLPCLLEL
eukprot:1170364-Alexandrium_andersonii.AAC.1